MQEGNDSSVALLQLGRSVLEGLSPAAAATHADAAFAFFQDSLDLVAARRARADAGIVAADSCMTDGEALSKPRAEAHAAADAEAAIVAAVVAIVMKLSEAQFRPLFLRMVEWAGVLPPAVKGVSCLLPPAC